MLSEQIGKAALVPAVDYNDMNDHMYVAPDRHTMVFHMFISFSSIDWDIKPTRQSTPTQTLTQGILGKFNNYLVLFLHKDVWKYK